MVARDPRGRAPAVARLPVRHADREPRCVLLHRLRAQLRHVDGPTLARRAPLSDDLSGGGLTTYSSFNYETLAMFDQGRTTYAVVDSLRDGARLRDRRPTRLG